MSNQNTKLLFGSFLSSLVVELYSYSQQSSANQKTYCHALSIGLLVVGSMIAAANSYVIDNEGLKKFTNYHTERMLNDKSDSNQFNHKFK